MADQPWRESRQHHYAFLAVNAVTLVIAQWWVARLVAVVLAAWYISCLLADSDDRSRAAAQGGQQP